MSIPMDAGAQQRALRALALMIQRGYGIMRAAREAHSSRRSIHKYMRFAGIRTMIRKGKMVIVKTMEQKMNEFILHMIRGDNATQAAKKAHTTVKTMSRQEVNGYPIIIKVGNKWVLNAYPLYKHSLVIYGHIVGLGDTIQGKYEEDGEIKSPDAADIWWQIDFDEFISTLPPYEVGEFWKEEIIEWLREELEIPILVNDVLSMRFSGNEEVHEHALDNNRIDDEGNILVTKLEEIMNRYNVHLHEYINYGIDDNHPTRNLEWITKEDLGEMFSEGLFQVFIVKDEYKTYPDVGPLHLVFEYNLLDERA